MSTSIICIQGQHIYMYGKSFRTTHITSGTIAANISQHLIGNESETVGLLLKLGRYTVKNNSGEYQGHSRATLYLSKGNSKVCR